MEDVEFFLKTFIVQYVWMSERIIIFYLKIKGLKDVMINSFKKNEEYRNGDAK